MRNPLKLIASSRIFRRDDRHYTVLQIIGWWEIRRIFFNFVVGVTGIITCALVLVLALFAEERFGGPIEFPDPPLFAVFGIIAYGIAANVCYTAGWICELFGRMVWPESAAHFGKLALLCGLVFSVGLTLVPFLFCFVIVVIKLITTI